MSDIITEENRKIAIVIDSISAQLSKLNMIYKAADNRLDEVTGEEFEKERKRVNALDVATDCIKEALDELRSI